MAESLPPPLTLCAHPRLASGLRAAYDAHQGAAGRQSWPAAPILTLDAWLARVWAAAGDRMLLTSLQERLLWRQVIAAHAPGRDLLDVDATAAAAADAWRLAQHWLLPLTGPAWQEREETAAFGAWAEDFHQLCRRQEWLSAAELPAALARQLGDAMSKCGRPLPGSEAQPQPDRREGGSSKRWLCHAARLPAAGLPLAMRWAGFDELTPQLQQLLRALRAAGVVVDIDAPGTGPSLPGVTSRQLGDAMSKCGRPLPGSDAQPQPDRREGGSSKRWLCHRFADPGSEFQAVAAWARGIVEQDPLAATRRRHEQVRASVAGQRCPATARPEGGRLQQEVAVPPAHIGIVVPGLAACRATVERIFLEVFHPRRPPWEDTPRAFHLSLGPPLAEAPVVAAALRLLEIFSTSSLLETSAALDWIGSPFLFSSDTEAAARARLAQDLRRQQRELWRWSDLARLTARHCPALAASLQDAHAVVRRWPHRQAHQPWTEAWAALWQALGWPGERPLDTAGWQTLAAWQRLLDEFGRLDQVAPAPVDPATALARLRRAAAARSFQPQAAPAPVQILGWLEASGLEFTHLWICGLDEQALPAPPQPHPFLPLALQRERDLPHASAAREAEVAQRLWRRLLCSSPDVHASFATSDAEGRLQLPSPLLTGWSACQHNPEPTQAPVVALETLDDDVAPPAAGAEHRAGSDLFLDQSACPFRAFAHQRLHARALPALAIGLPATVRGALLHRVLRDLWTAPDAGDFSAARIERLAAAAVAGERRLAGRPGLAAAECARLAATVLAWCEIERQRRPFRVVATEDCLAPAFAGLELHLRRDRIDELADGALALLDYKSGECSTGAWAGPYPEQPQLPLYLVTEPRRAQVAAIAFAQVRSGDMALAGVERAPGTLLPQPLAATRRRQEQVRASVAGERSPATARPEPGPPSRTRLGVAEGGRLQQEVAVPLAQPKWILPWDDQLARWERELRTLAEEYLQGVARVEPRQRESCNRCGLQALCRIREHAGPGEEEESDDDRG